jgi:hypothetical protein
MRSGPPSRTETKWRGFEVARRRWWGGDAPNRWTGRATPQDADAADEAHAGLNLRRKYELEFSPTCWAIHGSGLAGFRSTNTDFIPVQCGFRMRAVQDLAHTNLRLILDALGILSAHKFDQFERKAAEMVRALEIDA